jgi:hypothetical protein
MIGKSGKIFGSKFQRTADTISESNLLKGQWHEIFLFWLFSSIEPTWAPVSFTPFFLILFGICEAFEYKIRPEQWATAGNQFFLQIPGI